MSDETAGKLADLSSAQYDDEHADVRAERLADVQVVTGAGTQDFGPGARSQGVARSSGAAAASTEATAGGDEPSAVDDYAIGGGWYDLPDVGKVQGKENAEAELAKATQNASKPTS